MTEKKKAIALCLPAERVPVEAEKRIRAIDPSRDIIITADKQVLQENLERIEITAADFPRDFLPAAKNLKWHHQWYAGADWLLNHPEARRSPFILTNTAGVHGSQMAEHLFGLLIAWNRKFPEAFAAQLRKEWLHFKHSDIGLLSGQTLLIAGYGVIGRQVASVAEAFGMRVIGVRRTAEAETGQGRGPRVISTGQLKDVLSEADVVVNILPYTEETKLFFDMKIFSQMKRTALFANIGRGGSVNETDLAAALEKKIIAGAVLDVTGIEPLPAESPLWTAPGLLLTSHYSGFHPEYNERAFLGFLGNLERWVKGEPLANVVDKNLGY